MKNTGKSRVKVYTGKAQVCFWIVVYATENVTKIFEFYCKPEYNFCNIFCRVDNNPKANLSFSSIHFDTAFACILRFKRGQLFQNAYSTSKSVDCFGELELDTTNSRLSKKADL